MSKKVSFGTYSDDCSYVYVDGEKVTFSEYTDKRLIITTPSGEKIKISFAPMADTVINFPDGFKVKVEEDGYFSDENDNEWQGTKVTYDETC